LALDSNVAISGIAAIRGTGTLWNIDSGSATSRTGKYSRPVQAERSLMGRPPSAGRRRRVFSKGWVHFLRNVVGSRADSYFTGNCQCELCRPRPHGGLRSFCVQPSNGGIGDRPRVTGQSSEGGHARPAPNEVACLFRVCASLSPLVRAPKPQRGVAPAAQGPARFLVSGRQRSRANPTTRFP
jgi:hypothetical protein